MQSKILKKCWTIDEIKNKIVPIAKEYGINKVKLFGSYAKGKNNSNSDIDFIVEKGDMKTLFKYISFVDKLEKIFKCHIDVISTEIENQDFLNCVSKESILLYDKQK